MGKPELFNNEQKQFILDNWETMSNLQISECIGNNVTRQQVSSWLIRHGIKRNGKGCIKKNQIFTEDEIQFIKEHYAFMTCADMSKIIGHTAQQIKGKVDHLNLPKKKRTINSSYFKQINTSLKAYFLGFIYADGCVVCNENIGNYEFSIQLQSQDKYILERLNKELGNKNIIYHNDPTDVPFWNGKVIHSGHIDHLRVYSKELVCDLIKHGIVTNKSLKEVYPVVDDSLFFDFLRGYIDGDGCFYVDNKQTYMHITCGNKTPLEYIQRKLKEFNIKTQIYMENERKYRLMCTSQDEMNKLVNRLYYANDLFCLKRKYEKIKHFLGLAG